MKNQKIHIPIFDFDLEIVELELNDNGTYLSREMEDFGCTEEHIKHCISNIEGGINGGGECFRNLDKQKFLVVIYYHEKENKKAGTIAHELRHVVDHICEHCHIEDIEMPAYITGHIYEQLNA